MPEHFLSSPFLYSLALTLIHFIWQGVLISVALKSVLIFTPHNKPQLRYAFSSIAMLCNLILPIITFFIIYQSDKLALLDNITLSNIEQTYADTSSVSNTVWSQELVEYLPYLSVVWLVIITILASKIFFEIYSVNQLGRQEAKPAIGLLQARFNQLVTKLAITSSPKLLISLKVSVPMAIGWLKPVVLVPAAMVSGLTPTQLDMLILHELAHIRRHDYFVNFIQTLVETLLFFHPGVLWVSNQMRNEREYCSDDIAVQYSGDPIAYAHTLADTASLCRSLCKGREYSIPNMAMAVSGGDLKQRVIRLVGQHHCSSNQDSGKWIASIVIILSVMMWSLKQFIVFPNINIGAFTLYNKSLPGLSQVLVTSDLPEASVAHQLLAQSLPTKNNNGLPSSISEKVASKIKPKAELTDNKQFKQQPDNEKSYGLPLQKNILNNSQVKKSILNSDIKALAENIENTPTDPLSKINSKKSLSELAFERTDSNRAKSPTKNPYSEQIKGLTKPFENSVDDSLKKEPTTHSSNFIRAKVTDQKGIKIAPVYSDAKLVSIIEPRYPISAKRKGIEVDMMVHFTISSTGRVMNIQFEAKSKASYFRSAIRNAMKKWRYSPAMLDGKAVESKMSKLFSFNLKK